MQKIIHVLLCDLHGDDEVEGSETIPFSLDGRDYEIDVCVKDAAALRETLDAYVGGARSQRPVGRPRKGGRRPAKAAANGHSNAEIREWAIAQGRKISDRGRIPQQIVAEFEAAQGR